MPNIEIYTTPTCGFCRAAKRLLAKKGVEFIELDVAGKPDLRDEMTTRAGGRRTVPQIFVDGRHIGDCEDLFDLDYAEKLDAILAA
jgi:glutaredoxin 3